MSAAKKAWIAVYMFVTIFAVVAVLFDDTPARELARFFSQLCAYGVVFERLCAWCATTTEES